MAREFLRSSEYLKEIGAVGEMVYMLAEVSSTTNSTKSAFRRDKALYNEDPQLLDLVVLLNSLGPKQDCNQQNYDEGPQPHRAHHRPAHDTPQRRRRGRIKAGAIPILQDKERHMVNEGDRVDRRDREERVVSQMQHGKYEHDAGDKERCACQQEQRRPALAFFWRKHRMVHQLSAISKG
ncbi:hypothetical protein ARMGADRAFT_1039831 [Armillaria gallica]|uniref:Uncharacterized protein n=1 Tax=Armillaria gallica TaxID=47427 RepID=A0A2H3CCJ8_ARMGA|nr:hypothetical protein ARMGADRAFT_1039831 [Armillaria gallica]